MTNKKEVDSTTIKLKKQTKDRLDRFKVYSRETYDEILQRMLSILGTCRTNPEKAQTILQGIERQARKKLFIEKKIQKGEKLNSSSSKSLAPQSNLQQE